MEIEVNNSSERGLKHKLKHSLVDHELNQILSSEQIDDNQFDARKTKNTETGLDTSNMFTQSHSQLITLIVINLSKFTSSRHQLSS